jgi:hypothetical protein
MNRIVRNLWTLTAIAGLVLSMGFAASTASADIVGPFSTTVDFDASGDLDDFTHVSNGSSTIAHGTSNGSDGTAGRIDFTGTAGGDDSIFYYTPSAYSDGLIQLQNATDSATVSWDFEATDHQNAYVPRVGFRGNTTENSGNGDDIYTLARQVSHPDDFSLVLRNYVDGSLEDNVDDTDTFTFTQDDWYRMQLTLTKNATSDELGLETVLYSLTAGGNVNSTIDTFSQTFTNADLYNDGFYAYFDFQSNGTTDHFTDAADNFSLNITAAIPEPASLALLGIGALVMRLLRRRWVPPRRS